MKYTLKTTQKEYIILKKGKEFKAYPIPKKERAKKSTLENIENEIYNLNNSIRYEITERDKDLLSIFNMNIFKDPYQR